jgi:hypothetical protein
MTISYEQARKMQADLDAKYAAQDAVQQQRVTKMLCGLPRIDSETLDAAGIEHGGDYAIENGQAMRAFSGGYTIGEVKALLADMERVQEQLDIAALARTRRHRRP